MSLPIFKDENQNLMLMQTAWAKAINPLLKDPLFQGNLIQEVVLATGANTINHLLGRKLLGWFVVRQRAAGTFYDSQDSNPTPEMTLRLNSSANVTVDLIVF